MGPVRAVIFDFGGVVTESPFEAFNRYEEANGLPLDLLRNLNATNPHTNAWSKLERSHVSFSEFCVLYEEEAAALGHTINAAEVMASMAGGVRPEMVEALRRCASRLKTACITNNWAAGEAPGPRGEVMELFSVVVESSK